MVLMNAGSRARHVSSITNQSQSGGNKKAGFAHQVGRDSWTSIAIKTCNPQVKDSKCCKLENLNNVVFPLSNASRPIGSRPSRYWHIPNTGN